jgi:hypothetical protein
VVEADGGSQGAISPDRSHTEEAFRVNLDRIAPGAYLSVSVRHTWPEHEEEALRLGTGDTAVVHVHMPGDLHLQWGLGSEEDGGSGGLSAAPWEAPPDCVMPAGSVRVATWAGGSHAVLTPFRRTDSTLDIALPTIPYKGLAFVIFDAEKQCYYDNGGQAFFLNSHVAAVAAGKAQAAAVAAATAQADKLRRMASDEATAAATRQALDQRAASRAAARVAATAIAAAVGADSTPYQRYLLDPGNPFRDYVSPLAKASAAGFLTPSAQQRQQQSQQRRETPAPAAAHMPPQFATATVAVANPVQNPTPWPSATAGSYDAPSFDDLSLADDHRGGGSFGGGGVVATHSINLSTENGSSTGTLLVSILATSPPSVQLTASAGGAASGQPLLLHWGVSDRRGGTWGSPFDKLESVPTGSRAPDGQSCETALHDGEGAVEFAPKVAGVSCMTMLIRTENCQEWLRESDGGDVFIDISPALAAAAQGGGDSRTSNSSSSSSSSSGNNNRDFQPSVQLKEPSRHRNTPAPAPPPPRRRSTPPPPPPTPQGDHMALLSNWRGGDVELKNHKGGSGDRNNQWNTDNLPDAARHIVEGDRDSASWRQKLQAMERVLCFDDPGNADIDALGYASIYLFWVGVGAIACVEDGGGRGRIHASRFTRHPSPFTLHPSRFTQAPSCVIASVRSVSELCPF